MVLPAQIESRLRSAGIYDVARRRKGRPGQSKGQVHSGLFRVADRLSRERREPSAALRPVEWVGNEEEARIKRNVGLVAYRVAAQKSFVEEGCDVLHEERCIACADFSKFLGRGNTTGRSQRTGLASGR